MPVNIFISYRRGDAAGHAGRIFDRLEEHFPRCVFMDVSGIAPGTNFIRALERKLAACQVLIVVIGKSWLSITKERDGDDEPDHARIEVVTALRKGIPVIPVLVQGAPMPARKELPEDLKPLAEYNALEVTEPDFRNDVQRLAAAIVRLAPPQKQEVKRDAERIVAPPPPGGVPFWVKLFVGVGTAAVVGVVSIFIIIAATMPQDEDDRPPTPTFNSSVAGQTLDSTKPAPNGPDRKQKPTPEPSPEPEAAEDVKAQSRPAAAGPFSPAGTWLITVQTANGPVMGTYYLYPNQQMEFSAGALTGRGRWTYDGSLSALTLSGMNNLGVSFEDVVLIGERQGGTFQFTSTVGPGTMSRVQ